MGGKSEPAPGSASPAIDYSGPSCSRFRAGDQYRPGGFASTILHLAASKCIPAQPAAGLHHRGANAVCNAELASMHKSWLEIDKNTLPMAGLLCLKQVAGWRGTKRSGRLMHIHFQLLSMTLALLCCHNSFNRKRKWQRNLIKIDCYPAVLGIRKMTWSCPKTRCWDLGRPGAGPLPNGASSSWPWL